MVRCVYVKGQGKKGIFHGVSGSCEVGVWQEKTRLEQSLGNEQWKKSWNTGSGGWEASQGDQGG